MSEKDFICPDCKVIGDWEHKCHSNQFGDCDCPDCRVHEEFNLMSWEPRKCTCKKCLNDKVIQKFLDMFSKEEQKVIFNFIDFRNWQNGY